MSGQPIDLRYTFEAATTSNIAENRLPDAFPNISTLSTQTFGSTTTIPSIAVDSKGRVIQASNLTRLDASVVNTGTLSNAVLPNVGTAGTFGGTSTGIPVITTDAKGRVISATTTTIDTTIISSGLLPVTRGGTGTTATIGTGSLVFNSNTTLSNTTFLGTLTFPPKAINNTAIADMGGGLIAGGYGTATAVPVINVNSAGLITAISTAPIPTQANTGFLASTNTTVTNCNVLFNSNTNFNSTANFNSNVAFHSTVTFNSNTIYNSNASYIALLAASNLTASNIYTPIITSSNLILSNAYIINANLSNLNTSNAIITTLTASNVTLSNLYISAISLATLGFNNATGSNLNTSNISFSNANGSNLNIINNATISNASISNLNVVSISYSNASGSNLNVSRITTSNIATSNITVNNLTVNGVVSFPNGSITSNTLSNSGVTQGTYGAFLTVPTITVNPQGLITNISNNTPIPHTGWTVTNSTSNTTACNVVLSSNLAVLGNTTLSNTTITGTITLPSQSISSTSLVNTGVTAGAYTTPTITINSAGQITAITPNNITNSGFGIVAGNNTVTNCNVIINSNITANNITTSNAAVSNLNVANINVTSLTTSNLAASNLNASNLYTTFDTTIGGALTVNGATTLNGATTVGAINITGTTIVSASISATAQTTLNNLTVNGIVTLPNKAINPTAIADSLTTPGTYGNTTSVPVLTVNSTGLITGISTATLQIPGFSQTGATISTNSNLVFNSNVTLVGSLVLTPTFVPPSPMTANTSTIAGGSYIASSSGTYDPILTAPWNGFDGNPATYWASPNNSFPNTNFGNPNRPITTTVDGTSRQGEWLQLQLPTPTNLRSYTLRSILPNIPQSWILAASVDGTTWTAIDTQNGFVANDWNNANNNSFTFYFNNTNTYTYFRLIVLQASGVAVFIGELILMVNPLDKLDVQGSTVLRGPTAITTGGLTVTGDTTFSNLVNMRGGLVAPSIIGSNVTVSNLNVVGGGLVTSSIIGSNITTSNITASNVSISNVTNPIIFNSTTNHIGTATFNTLSLSNASINSNALVPSGVITGTYGNPNTIPVLTVNTQGLVTGISTVTTGWNLNAGTINSTCNLTVSGITTLNSNLTVTAPVALSNVTISNLTLSNINLTGTINLPPGSITNAALTNTGVNATTTTYGSGSSIPQITVNPQGIITSVAPVSVIIPPTSGFTLLNNISTTNCNVQINCNLTVTSNTTLSNVVMSNLAIGSTYTNPAPNNLIVQGSVGIGKISPATALDVNGTITTTSITSTTTNAGTLSATNTTGTGNFVLANAPTLTGTTTVATINSTTTNAGTLAATNTTGTGNFVLANAPTLTGTTTVATLTATTINSTSTNAGTLSATNTTGTGNFVLATAPTLSGTTTVATINSTTTNAGTLSATNVTGTGNFVLATAPTLTGTTTVATINSTTTNAGTLSATNVTGTGNFVLATAPTLTGTTTVATLAATTTNAGTLSATNVTGTGNFVLATAPTLTGTTTVTALNTTGNVGIGGSLSVSGNTTVGSWNNSLPPTMTANTSQFNNGNTTYIASSSGDFTGSAPWYAFDNDTSTWWDAPANSYPNVNLGTAINNTLTTVSGNSARGEWLQILLPLPLVPISYSIRSRTTINVPQTWVLAASSNAITWTSIDSQTAIASSTWGSATNNTITFNLNTTTAYSYYRLIINQSNGSTVSIVDFKINIASNNANIAGTLLVTGTTSLFSSLTTAGTTNLRRVIVTSDTWNAGISLASTNSNANTLFDYMIQRGATNHWSSNVMVFHSPSINNAGFVFFTPGANPRFFIRGSDGNIGIGTTLPGSRFSVLGNAAFGTLYSSNLAPTDGLIVQGNVGIATTNPTTALDVNGVSTMRNYLAILQASVTPSAAGITFSNNIYGSTSACYLDAYHHMTFEPVTLASGAGFLLKVQSGQSFGGGLRLQHTADINNNWTIQGPVTAQNNRLEIGTNGFCWNRFETLTRPNQTGNQGTNGSNSAFITGSIHIADAPNAFGIIGNTISSTQDTDIGSAVIPMYGFGISNNAIQIAGWNGINFRVGNGAANNSASIKNALTILPTASTPNVGIGTSTPTTTLDVNGGLTLRSSTNIGNQNNVFFQYFNNSFPGDNIFMTHDGHNPQICVSGADTAFHIAMQAYGAGGGTPIGSGTMSRMMTFRNTGSVSIGTTLATGNLYLVVFGNSTLSGTPVSYETTNAINYINTAFNGITQNYSFRIFGYIIPPVSGAYTFQVQGDDNVKLSINGIQIANVDFAAGTFTTSSVTLTANTYVSILIENTQTVFGSSCVINWRNDSTQTSYTNLAHNASGGIQFSITAPSLEVFGGITARQGWRGTSSTASLMGGVIQTMWCERNGLTFLNDRLAWGNGSVLSMGMYMPFSGKIHYGALSSYQTAGTGAVVFAITRTDSTNTSNVFNNYAISNVDNSRGAVADWRANPFTFNAGDRICVQCTQVNTGTPAGSNYHCTMWYSFD